ncbi:uncharacterized protein LOC143840384 isoform X2 [Paroedura picta]|uniref:uncharacterized protein LOC143840384 isoform X2 n=1 Tax=Paroedura picta TaxID=143630 RepID=UPI004056EACF
MRSEEARATENYFSLEINALFGLQRKSQDSFVFLLKSSVAYLTGCLLGEGGAPGWKISRRRLRLLPTPGTPQVRRRRRPQRGSEEPQAGCWTES